MILIATCMVGLNGIRLGLYGIVVAFITLLPSTDCSP